MKKIILRIFIFIVVTVVYMFAESYMLLIKTVDLKDSDIPLPFDRKKIVFVSDIHHGPHFSKKRIGKLVNRINSLKPDIILLGGDYVENDAKYIKPCFEELQYLNAPLGVFGVLGNHDHSKDVSMVEGEMKKAGITLLKNKAEWVSVKDGGIKIGGVDDLYFGRKDIGPTVNDVQEEDFVILLSHNPDYAEKIKNNKIDIVLSGHTHGGQITLFGLWAPYIPSNYGQKYRSGMVETDYTKVYVSKGVGTNVIPLRFFTHPEITVVNLIKE